MHKLFLTVAVACLFLVSCNASKTKGIAGKWQASMGPNADMVMTYVFNVDGDVLTGTVTTPMGEQEISNGVVNGNEFSFELMMHEHAMKHTGVLDGDVIKLKMVRPEGDKRHKKPEGAPQGEMQEGQAPQGPPPGDSINKPKPPKDGENAPQKPKDAPQGDVQKPGHGGPGGHGGFGGEMTLTRVK